MGRVREMLLDPYEDDGTPIFDEPVEPPSPTEMVERAARIGRIHEAQNGSEAESGRYRLTTRRATESVTHAFPDAPSASLAFNDMATHLTRAGFKVAQKPVSVRFEGEDGEWFEIDVPIPA